MKIYLELLDRLVKSICVLLFSLLFFIILLQILYRYLFKSPLIWTEEGARILFIWICLLGGTIAHRSQTHIGIDYFVNKLAANLSYRLSLILRLLIISFLLLLFITGLSLTQKTLYVTSITLPWINWGYIYCSVPVSAFIMLLYSIDETARLIKFRFTELPKNRY